MKIQKLKQGSQDWLRWRRMHLTASDASSILGVNPFKSILQLYEEKVFEIEQEDNDLMAEGRRLEPIALEQFQEETDYIMFPVVVESSEIDWMGASLDGMTIDQKVFVEIKCGQGSYVKMTKDKIDDFYIAQMQHQLAVTGHDTCYYYCYNDHLKHGILAIVNRDDEYIEKMIAKERDFWNCLKTLTPPPKAEKILCNSSCYSKNISMNPMKEELIILN